MKKLAKRRLSEGGGPQSFFCNMRHFDPVASLSFTHYNLVFDFLNSDVSVAVTEKKLHSMNRNKFFLHSKLQPDTYTLQHFNQTDPPRKSLTFTLQKKFVLSCLKHWITFQIILIETENKLYIYILTVTIKMIWMLFKDQQGHYLTRKKFKLKFEFESWGGKGFLPQISFRRAILELYNLT